MLWDANGATDLNIFLSQAAIDAGWVLGDATGINDAGSITGNARNTHLQGSFVFTLTVAGGPIPAVPETGTFALLVVGLAAIAGSRGLAVLQGAASCCWPPVFPHLRLMEFDVARDADRAAVASRCP
jgi:hypothetical protein